jgi:predicted component of type VI protein secretion system
MPADTRTCPVCWTPFTATGRRVYCSKKCRGTAWERRHQRQAPPAATGMPSPAPAPQPVTTTGCPHCGQPITVIALLTTPQAARPRLPGTTPHRHVRPL